MGRPTKLNVLTSPEQIAQVNPKNMRLKKDFLSYLKSIQRSPGTINGYSNDLDIFFVWLLENADNKFFVDVTKRDIVSFQTWLMEENQNSPARIRRLKACLSSLSNYIENILDDEYPDYKPVVRKIESPVNQPVREKTILTRRQVKFVLNKLVKAKRYDVACMFALAASCGARKAELTKFKVEYFTEANLTCNGALWKTNERIKTKGQGLGKYIYKYIMVDTFQDYLRMWMEERRRTGIDSIWLFPREDDPDLPMRTTQMNSWAHTITRILGEPFYWHSLRHYCCTELYRQQIPDSIIQVFFGWSSQEMVGVYKDVDEDEELEKYFSVSIDKRKQLNESSLSLR